MSIQTSNLKISIASDHAGFISKSHLIEHLKKNNIQVYDFGCYSESSVDYPDFAHKVAQSVSSSEFNYGVLICGSGQGVCITANKYQNIRASLCWSKEVALLSRQHNNANVICLPGRFLNIEQINSIVDCFISTEFEGGRHQMRIDKIPLNQ